MTVRELPISKDIAGVEMRLTAVASANCTGTWKQSGPSCFMETRASHAVNHEGKSFVERCHAKAIFGYFPKECRTPSRALLRTDAASCWFSMTEISTNSNLPPNRLARTYSSRSACQELRVPESTFANVPEKELFIFQRELPDPLTTEQKQAAAGTGAIDQLFVFRPSTINPQKSPGAER